MGLGLGIPALGLGILALVTDLRDGIGLDLDVGVMGGH